MRTAKSLGLLALLAAALCMPASGLRAAATEAEIAAAVAKAPGRNLARGKPYRFSRAPTGKWHDELRKRGHAPPDVTRILTDGEEELGLACWTSNRCVSFADVDSVEVVVDLGDVYPVSEIRTRHGARPGAGIRLPWKEQYLVSEDGENFVEVGEFVNEKDPATPPPGGDRSSLFTGRLTFSSGPLRTRGRYVAVRTWTWPEDRDGPASLRFERYVGYDEIVVVGGRFGREQARLDAERAAPLQARFDPSVFGYRIAPPDWARIARETPLYIALTPQQFLGDDEYHLSPGGTFVLTFQCYDNAGAAARGVEFTIDFPATVTVHDHNGRLPTTSGRIAQRDGSKLARYTQTLIDEKRDEPRSWPFFVVSASGESGAELGSVEYRYRYTMAGRRIESGPQRIRLVLAAPIEAPSPRKTLSGFWVPYPSRFFTRKDETLRRLFSFYREAGFNGANGGYSDPVVHAHLTKLGMQDFTGSGLSPNALMFGRFDAAVRERMSREAPFVRHPRARRKADYGVCPTRFLDPRYDALRRQVAQGILARTTHVYENWEPHMFLGQGCVCEACREAYRRFAGLGEQEIAAQWPDVVLRPNARYEDFVSLQYGQIVLALQAAVTAAGRERAESEPPAYVPSINPAAFFDPREAYYRMHNARDYFGGIAKLMIWRYDNTVSLLGFDPAQTVGSNLTVTRDFDNTLELVRRHGRKVEGGALPKIYYLSTEGYKERFVLPADHYFVSVLAFVHGLDGWGTWTMNFKPDARYLAAQARANRVASAYEDVVAGGKVLPGCRAERVPSAAQARRPSADTVYVRGFARGERRVVALGLDDHRPAVVTLRVPGLASGDWRLVDRLHGVVYTGDGDGHGGAFSASELDQGVRIDMPAKTWRMLELVGAGGASRWEGLERRTQRDVERQVERSRQEGGASSS